MVQWCNGLTAQWRKGSTALIPFIFVAPVSIFSHLENFCSGACFGKRSSFYKYFASLRLETRHTSVHL
jgi:hypothetical protein